VEYISSRSLCGILAHCLRRERVHGEDGGAGRAVQRDGGVHGEGLRRGGQRGALRGVA
jgi:hypothetical protein